MSPPEYGLAVFIDSLQVFVVPQITVRRCTRVRFRICVKPWLVIIVMIATSPNSTLPDSTPVALQV
eukprot:12141200-Heterocapsa_arctica.AAC.1